MAGRNGNYYYAQLAQTVNLEDITSSPENTIILQKLRDNDSAFDYLQITGDDDFVFGENDFWIEEGDDLGWLGYFVGNNTTLRDLAWATLPSLFLSDLEPLFSISAEIVRLRH